MRAHAHSHDELRAKEKIDTLVDRRDEGVAETRDRERMRIRIRKLKSNPTLKLLKRRS